MNINIDCKSVSKLLSDSLEREIDAGDRLRLAHHFGICEVCRNVNEQMSLLHRAMKSIDEDHGRDAPDQQEHPARDIS